MARPVSASKFVYERIKSAIISGKFRSNEVISETYLSEMLSVSRTPIRETLERLQAEGLIIRTPSGAMVKYLNPREAVDLEMVRMPLEGLSAYLAAKTIDEEGKLRLKKALEAALSYNGKDMLKLSEVNDEFHRVIALESHNKYLIESLERIRINLKLSTSIMYITEKRRLQSKKEHTQIATAIMQHKPLKARLLAEQHVMKTYKLLVNRISF